MYDLGKDLAGSSGTVVLCLSTSAGTLRNTIDGGRIWDIFWNSSLIAD